MKNLTGQERSWVQRRTEYLWKRGRFHGNHADSTVPDRICTVLQSREKLTDHEGCVLEQPFFPVCGYSSSFRTYSIINLNVSRYEQL